MEVWKPPSKFVEIFIFHLNLMFEIWKNIRFRSSFHFADLYVEFYTVFKKLHDF